MLRVVAESQPRMPACANLHTQRALTLEYMGEVLERQARNYDKLISEVSFNNGDLISMGSRALRSAQEGMQPKNFAMRCVGP